MSDDSTAKPKRAPSPKQVARRELRRALVLDRLNDLADAARLSDFTIGVRVPQPPEVQRLQHRVRGVTGRWGKRWTTREAAIAPAGSKTESEHVVPVIVLVERILKGDDVEAVVAQSEVCRVLYDEHKHALAVAFRDVHAELYAEMLDCPLGDLAPLGWQRYEFANLTDRFLLPR